MTKSIYFISVHFIGFSLILLESMRYHFKQSPFNDTTDVYGWAFLISFALVLSVATEVARKKIYSNSTKASRGYLYGFVYAVAMAICFLIIGVVENVLGQT